MQRLTQVVLKKHKKKKRRNFTLTSLGTTSTSCCINVINPNPEKIQVILDMAPWSMKEVQHLNGRLIVLNRFIARLRERILSFFKTLRYISNYEWTLYCQKAFKELKVHFSSLKILSTRKSEFCFFNLKVLDSAMSEVLVKEYKGIQHPNYYSS
jgi:hypothetical protein